MHVGKFYPWHEDLWACSAQWWPGWIARKMFWSWGIGSLYPWDLYAGVSQVSEIGIVSMDRETVTYNFPLLGTTTIAQALLYTAGAGTAKSSRWQIFLNDTRFNTPAAALADPIAAPVYDAAPPNADWPTGTVVSPNTGYVIPENLVLRPAVWAEV